MANVRFVKTTKQKWLNRDTYDMNALYFCEDTQEIYKGNALYTEGVKVIPTRDALPSFECAADGVVYYITDTRAGFMLAPTRDAWLQTIYAPVTDVKTIPEGEEYNVVTTVGAVRDIERAIYDYVDTEIAQIEMKGGQGEPGKDGTDGQTPYIKDGNWWIGESDTGVKAEGVDGKDGVNGADGKDGVNGKSAYELAVENGYNGDVQTWLASLVGAKGQDGVNGTNGTNGKSAYELAVDLGYEGTEAEWIMSLAGKNGADGKDGVDGKDGADGKNGVDGIDGKTPMLKIGEDNYWYVSYDDGATWINLNVKATGEDGKDGADGADGKDGINGTDGKDGADGKDGVDGKDGLTTSIKLNGAIYEQVGGVIELPDVHEVPFVDDKYVTNAFGGFTVGESVKGLSVAEILVKLLGLSDTNPNAPETPEVLETAEEIIADIIQNQKTISQLNSEGELVETEYTLLTVTAEEDASVEQVKPTQSGFYQILDDDNNVVESGYQQVQVKAEDMPYMIALPDTIDYNTHVIVELYREMDKTWQPTTLSLTSDKDEIAEICDLEGCAVPEDIPGYTIWVGKTAMSSNTIYRFIITNKEAA